MFAIVIHAGWKNGADENNQGERAMRRAVMMAAAAMMACSGLMAADAAGAPDKQKQMEKLGALRGRLMLKLSELPKAVDANQTGAMVAYTEIQTIQGKVSQTIAKQLQEESAKAQEVRFQPAIDALNKKNQRNSELGNEFNAKDWATYNKKMAEQYQVYSGLNLIFQRVADLELSWINAGFDLDALSDLLSMLDKKADDCKAQAMAATAELTKQVSVWETFAKE